MAIDQVSAEFMMVQVPAKENKLSFNTDNPYHCHRGRVASMENEQCLKAMMPLVDISILRSKSS